MVCKSADRGKYGRFVVVRTWQLVRWLLLLLEDKVFLGNFAPNVPINIPQLTGFGLFSMVALRYVTGNVILNYLFSHWPSLFYCKKKKDIKTFPLRKAQLTSHHNQITVEPCLTTISATSCWRKQKLSQSFRTVDKTRVKFYWPVGGR